MGLRPAWIQTSLRIRAVWSGSMLSAISFSTCYRVCKRTAWILIRLRGCALCWFCHDTTQMTIRPRSIVTEKEEQISDLWIALLIELGGQERPTWTHRWHVIMKNSSTKVGKDWPFLRMWYAKKEKRTWHFCFWNLSFLALRFPLKRWLRLRNKKNKPDNKSKPKIWPF
jgi:hypothetical protein